MSSHSISGEQEKRTVALSTLAAALFITVLKLAVGVWTGSLGILAEAADSTLDVIAAILTFAAVRVSGRPPDESHPYGHGKVESLAALVETLLLLVTCGWIIYEAISRLFFKSVEIEANAWAFGVVIMCMIIDFNRMRALQRTAEKYRSQALEASALRFRTDIWTSSVVLLGLTLVRITQWLGGPALLLKGDAVAGLAVAIVVLCLGVQLGRRAVDVLMDRAPEGLPQKIAGLAEQIEGVSACRRVRVRPSGAATFVDVVLEIEGDASFDTAHEITARVEQMVGHFVPRSDVVIHYEPGEESADLVTRVKRMALQMGAGAHSIRIREVEDRRYVELHLEVNSRSSLEEAHDLATRLEQQIKRFAPEVAEVVAHLEPTEHAPAHGTPLGDADYRRMRERIVTLVDATTGEGTCHQVMIWAEEDGWTASLHCSLSPELSIDEAHQLGERLEANLREEIPQLHRVVIHLEPPQ